jgi:adenylate cyclase
VAILAGTLLARRMLIPITALRTGARRLGAGDFGQRIDVRTHDELEELADQFNSQFEDHTKRAVKMAMEMRDAIALLTQKWRNRGHSLGFGVGIALGYATLGQVGFEHRLEYAAIGSVTNLASRLCDEAKANQVVVSRRVYGMVEQWVEAAPIDDLVLKGFNHPVLAVEILRWREEVENVVGASAAATRRRKGT